MKAFGRQRAAGFVGGMIAPYTQRHPIARIGKSKLAVRLLFTRESGRGALDLHMARAPARAPFCAARRISVSVIKSIVLIYHD